MLRTIILEDELSAQQLLTNILNEYCPSIQLVGKAGSLDAALSLIEQENPEIIFLDIELEDCTSFDILNAIDYSAFKIIFTTAHEEHAL